MRIYSESTVEEDFIFWESISCKVEGIVVVMVVGIVVGIEVGIVVGIVVGMSII